MDNNDYIDASSEMLKFSIRHAATQSGPRVGELTFRGRSAIATPAFVTCTSRGVVPHITPDLVQKHTSISVAYAGLEDFLEKSRQDAPILSIPDDVAVQGSAFRAYTGLSGSTLSILGPRRVPRLDTPHQSTNSAISISTSFGFAVLELEDYNRAVSQLRPDVSTSFVDLVQADRISRKRLEKSADRTHAWLRDTVDDIEKKENETPIFASIPPLEPEQQHFYLSDLVDEFKHYLSGICVYEPTTVPVIPESLAKLPVLCLTDPQSPNELLSAISAGVDLITTSFVTTTSESGIVLTFKFHPPSNNKNQALGFDMWSASHTTDLSPLAPSCQCYTCTRHHRAYLHHLLQAKEMLAWTLLQIHNFHIIAEFFNDVRQSIAKGTFEEDSKAFRLAYESGLPQKTGQGPRVRGYQVRSLGPGEPKINEKAYNKFDEQTLKIEEAESGIATPTADQDAETLEDQGLGQKIE